jgi:2-oxoglutarate dehydrogenase E1 component
MEPSRNNWAVDLAQKKRILAMLTAAETFERFLHTKFIGHKRFSGEGAETMIPILHELLEMAGEHDVREVVIGMAHRGRLNVLANVIGKPYTQILSSSKGT